MSTSPTVTQNNLPADPSASLKTLLEQSSKEIAAALPKHVTPERMMRIALTEARKNPQLLACDRASFLGAVIQASQLGLEPGGALGHCYLVPYRNKGRLEVQFQIGYRGMLDLVRRADAYSHVIARAVYKGDEFSYEFGLEERLVHKPKANGGELTHVYAIAFPKSGGKPIFDVMEKIEVDAIRARSQSGSTGPWNTDYEAMAKKTVIRRLFKYLPSSIEMQRAITLDELADAGVTQDNAGVIEVTGKAVDDKVESLNAKLGLVKPESEVAPAEPAPALNETDWGAGLPSGVADPVVIKPYDPSMYCVPFAKSTLFGKHLKDLSDEQLKSMLDWANNVKGPKSNDVLDYVAAATAHLAQRATQTTPEADCPF